MKLMPSTVTLILIFSFAMIAISLIIGFVSSKKVTSDKDFFGGTGLFGPVAVGLASTAGVASAFAIVGVPGVIYNTGSPMAWWMLSSGAFALGYMILGKKVRAMAEIRSIASLGDLSDARFNNNKLIKGLMSIIVSIACIGYLASQISAGSTLFGHLLGVDPIIAAIIIFGLLTVYTVIAGEVGGLLTQAFQGFIMVFASLVMIIMFFKISGGFGPAAKAVAEAGTVTGTNGVTKELGPKFLSAWGSMKGSMSFVWMFVPFFGVIAQPAVLVRMYAIKDPRELPKAALVSGIAHMFVAFLAVSVAYGVLQMVATGEIQPLEHPDQAIYVFADKAGAFAQLLVYAAVLAASMSSASAYLTTTSTLLSRDLPKALGINIHPKKQRNVTRVFMAAMGIIAIFVSIYNSDLVGILGAFGYGTLVSAMFPVFLVGMLWERANEKGVLAGLVVSFILTLVTLTPFVWPGGLPGYFHVTCISLAVTIFVSLLTPKVSVPEDIRLAMKL